MLLSYEIKLDMVRQDGGEMSLISNFNIQKFRVFISNVHVTRNGIFFI